MHPYLAPQLRVDLSEIVHRSELDFRTIGDRDVVITGASGFVGTWLTLSYLEARRQLGLRGKLVLISRRPQAQESLLLSGGYKDGFDVVAADVRTVGSHVLPTDSLVVHAATPARASLNNSSPLEMLDIILGGQRNLLEAAARRGVWRLLFMSSGAVYGRQPHNLKQLPETWMGSPDVRNVSNAYHEGKRTAELMGNLFAAADQVEFLTARLFAFLAPFLPTREHFAAGNFLGDAHEGREIVVNSGGGSTRTYQYGTDMSVWLWRIAAAGASGGAYNVGAEEETTIGELARLIAEQSPNSVAISIRGHDSSDNVSRYVPDTTLIRAALNVNNEISLVESVRRTLRWMGEA